MTPDLLPHDLQSAGWPGTGRHILADHDESSIVVYQAYRPSIATHALAHQAFGGPDFSFSRMSWIKPNFLWMMYRSSWGTAAGQECVLGIRVPRETFDALLVAAVPSGHDRERYPEAGEWKAALRDSEVRSQWDPDHDPHGTPLPRRAVQLGLRGDTLRSFATEQVIEIVDMTPVVEAGRPFARSGEHDRLLLPTESVYRPEPTAARAIGIDHHPE